MEKLFSLLTGLAKQAGITLNEAEVAELQKGNLPESLQNLGSKFLTLEAAKSDPTIYGDIQARVLDKTDKKISDLLTAKGWTAEEIANLKGNTAEKFAFALDAVSQKLETHFSQASDSSKKLAEAFKLKEAEYLASLENSKNQLAEREKLIESLKEDNVFATFLNGKPLRDDLNSDFFNVSEMAKQAIRKHLTDSQLKLVNENGRVKLINTLTGQEHINPVNNQPHTLQDLIDSTLDKAQLIKKAPPTPPQNNDFQGFPPQTPPSQFDADTDAEIQRIQAQNQNRK